jgi:preprotein translocase subunit YajC
MRTDATNVFWPHTSELELGITVGVTLELDLMTRNTGTESITIGDALHSYFSVSDVRHIAVEGLEDCPYIDKLDSDKRKQQAGPVTFSAETDRIYLDASADCLINDPGMQRRIRINKRGKVLVKTVAQRPVAAFVCLLFAMNVSGDEVIINNGDRLTGTVKTTKQGKLIIETGYAGEVKVQLSDIKRSRLNMKADGDLERTNNKKNKQKGRLGIKYDYFFDSEDFLFHQKWYLWSGVGFEHDKFADLNLRTTTGLGPGYQILETERTQLSVEGGASYIWENFDSSKDNDYVAARWALNFKHQLF